MSTMRAKMYVEKVTNYNGEANQEFFLRCVTGKPFDAQGISEDNSFSKYTPDGDMRIRVTNPALVNALKPGENYYIDFTKADA